MPRVIAIGDIHGCSRALSTLLNAIAPSPSDTLVMLGDYVDRGPNSRGVLDRLIELEAQCQVIFLLGNHDEMMLASRTETPPMPAWLNHGGEATLRSYGDAETLELVPEAHFRFLERCQLHYETETHFFVHANYDALLPLEHQDVRTLLWVSLRDRIPEPHESGKMAIVGHTHQATGAILDLGYLACLDTGCCYGNWLTALDVVGGQLWQTNQRGELRHSLHPLRKPSGTAPLLKQSNGYR